MKRGWLVVLVAVALSAASVLCAEDDPELKEKALAIVERVRGSLVQVEWTLKFDRGEAPKAGGWTVRCPYCGNYHGCDLEEVVEDERPYEAGGFGLSPTEVITQAPLMHPRFVESINVRFRDQVIGARPVAYGINQNAVILRLDAPLEGVAPLVFDSEEAPPYFVVTYEKANGDWAVNVKGLSGAVAARSVGKPFTTAAPFPCLVVDVAGAPVGMTMTGELPTDGSWKGSPKLWPAISDGKMMEALQDLEERFRKGVVRVQMSFRSPKKASSLSHMDYFDEDDEATERDAFGLLIDDHRVLVLALLRPKVTARLERITVHAADGRALPAEFLCALKGYGAFVASLNEPLPGTVPLSSADVRDFRNRLLLSVDARLQGEECTTYFWHNRITSFETGRRGQVLPEVGGTDENLFLFDAEQNLLAFPVARRQSVGAEDRWDYGVQRLVSAEALGEILSNLSGDHVDPANVPLSEAQENRLAWLGVELQALNKELARINKVSHLTSDGETGALVSYVYPDSPASQAGVKVGDILVRIHAEGEPRPIDVQVEDMGYSGEGFPWERLNMIPEEYLDQIPRPWPSVENVVSRALTDLGFGRRIAAELVCNGEAARKEFAIVESPPHYDSADRFKSDDLGMTVRDMTYEVRRYFQKTPDDPGVIVSKVKPGSKAFVSGIRPYEIITHVNDQPVTTVGDFERSLAGQDELRLSVKRRNVGRVVKMKPAVPSAAARPEASPGLD